MTVKYGSIIALFCLLLLPSWAWAVTYYVDATDGSDVAAGTSTETAWQTIEKINDYAEVTGFANGDTIKFQREETWTGDETLGYDASAHFIDFGIAGLTFEDYGSGALPFFDGDSQQPINIRDDTLSNLTIKNIDVSGQGWQVGKSTNVFIREVSGVVIDGLYLNGHVGSDYNGKNGITLGALPDGEDELGCSGTVEIKNCTVFNLGPETIPSVVLDFVGLVVIDQNSGTLSIHDNTVHTINDDGIQLYHNLAATTLYDNDLYNCGEQPIDIKSSSNITVYDNEIYRTAGFTGLGGITDPPDCIEIHDTADLETMTTIVVRNNDIHCGNGVGIRVMDNMAEVEIYNNEFTDSVGGIWVYREAINVSIHHNLFHNGADDCLKIGISTADGATLTAVYNNVFYECDESIIVEEAAWSAENDQNLFKNNISINPDNYHVKSIESILSNTFDYNSYYPDTGTLFYLVDTAYNFTDWKTQTSQDANSITSDPVVSSTSDFHLQNTSPCIDTGTDVSLTTDYDGVAIPQGAGVDRGAYEYLSATIQGCTITGGVH